MNEQTEAISKKREKWISAVNFSDVEKYMSILSGNIIWFPPIGQVIHGTEEFRKWVEPFFAKFNYEFSLSHIKIKVIDDWAIESGVFNSKLTSKTHGKMMEHSGNYIIFWHCEKDNDWKIERYVDNTDS